MRFHSNSNQRDAEFIKWVHKVNRHFVLYWGGEARARGWKIEDGAISCFLKTFLFASKLVFFSAAAFLEAPDIPNGCRVILIFMEFFRRTRCPLPVFENK